MPSRSLPQSGNVFFALFGAVGLVGVIGAATMTIMKGPVAGMQKVTKYTVAENAMVAAGRLALVAASQDANSGDCDADGFIEPRPWDGSGSGTGTPPTGGGFLPASIGAAQQDPWGRRYGYCAWDHGAQINASACGGASQNRRAGTTTEDKIVIAIISAGPDRTFQTSCANHNTYMTKPGSSDDVVMSYTYAEARSLGGGLWNIKTGDPATAEIAKNLEVKNSGGNVVFGVDSTTDATKPAIKVDYIQKLSVARKGVEFLSNIMLGNTWLSGDGDAEGIRIDASGNVGVGITAPRERLDIAGGHSFHTGGALLHYFNGYYATTSRYGGYGGSGYSGGIAFTPATGVFNIQSTAAAGASGAASTLVDRLTILPNGNVGVGTSNPSTKLVVEGGTIKVGNAGAANSYLQLEPQAGFHRVAYSQLRFWDWDAGGDMMTLDNGNVGIGTTGPTQRFHVAGGNALVNGEVISTGSGGNQFRTIQGNYGSFIRNDGNATYWLLTNSGDQYGTWNSLRPFMFNNATGDVTMAHNATVGGALGVTGAATVSGLLNANGGVVVDGKTVVSDGYGTVHTAHYGDHTRYGYFEARNSSGARGFYLGYGNGGSQVDFVLENATSLYFNGGTINMNGNRIINLGAPTGANDAATKAYVDASSFNTDIGDARYLRLAGGTMTGAINMSHSKITNLATPTAAADAATKAYVDSAAAGAKDNLGAGGSTPGNIYINNGSPTLYFQDTDARSSMIHVNSGTFHILTGSGNNATGWAMNGGHWPLTINLANDAIVLGGQTYIRDGGLDIDGGALQINGNAILSSAGTIRDGGGGWVRTYGNTGWYNQTHGGGWTMEDSIWVRTHGGKSVYSGAGEIRSDNNMRAPIFYDQNDANFHVDPNGISRVNRVDFASGYDLNDGNYFIDLNNLTYMKQLAISNDMNSPIFYDRNDTNYYTDPNGTSQMNAVHAHIFRDRNDTNYYVDPSIDSRMSRILADRLLAYSDLTVNSPSVFGGLIRLNGEGEVRTNSDAGSISMYGAQDMTQPNGAGIQLHGRSHPDHPGMVFLDAQANGAEYGIVFRMHNGANNTYRNVGVWQGHGNLTIYGSSKTCVIGDAAGLSCPSDIRLKQNVRTVENALKMIEQSRGVRYQWNDKTQYDTEEVSIGVIAQEMQKVLPEGVKVGEKGYLRIDLTAYIPVLIEAVKELKHLFDDLVKQVGELSDITAVLKDRDRALTGDVDALKAKSEELEREINSLKKENRRLLGGLDMLEDGKSRIVGCQLIRSFDRHREYAGSQEEDMDGNFVHLISHPTE